MLDGIETTMFGNQPPAVAGVADSKQSVSARQHTGVDAELRRLLQYPIPQFCIAESFDLVDDGHVMRLPRTSEPSIEDRLSPNDAGVAPGPPMTAH
jgi:hypothetical protein